MKILLLVIGWLAMTEFIVINNIPIGIKTKEERYNTLLVFIIMVTFHVAGCI
jgi:hypothetical protein